MTTEELEALLDGAEETDSLEFKGAMAWNRKLVKDILAMANVIDGGRIVIGIKDGTGDRQSLSDDQAASYNIEKLRDEVAPFADPRVVFRCDIVIDREGRRLAVLSVSPFEDLPVICRKDGPDIAAGSIYFRSRTRRPASARVDNSADMRDIVERAAALSTRRLKRMGFMPVTEPGYDYDAELGGL